MEKIIRRGKLRRKSTAQRIIIIEKVWRNYRPEVACSTVELKTKGEAIASQVRKARQDRWLVERGIVGKGGQEDREE